MKRQTITGTLRTIIHDLGYKEAQPNYSDVYSYNRISVKFYNLLLNDKEKEILKERMEKEGFKYNRISEVSQWLFNIKTRRFECTEKNSTRFCFYNK